MSRQYIVIDGDQQAQPTRRRRQYGERDAGASSGAWGVIVFIFLLVAIGLYLAIGG